MAVAMRVCPKCQTVHGDSTEYCPDDGTLLEPAGQEFAIADTAHGFDRDGESPSDDNDDGTDPGGHGIRVIPKAWVEHPEDNTPTEASPSLPAGPRDSTSPVSSLLIGRVIGGVYRVIEQIGVGGMGEVYRVEHTNLKKEFALKVLSKVAQDHPEAVERFRQEAIAASHIDHDNIVDIINLDRTEEGHFFIVMELLRGQSLAKAMEAPSAMSLERATAIIFQICRALHAAHEEGIIHRDLKPENVFLTRKGDAEFVKILDFGISKIHAAESDRVRITRTGQFLGTPLYMSPEQARGEPNLDRRVDIYSLGVMMYEMIEGRPPFSGENYFQLIWKHSNETAPPLEGNAPDRLKAVILRTLSKEPSYRFTDMIALEEAIAAAVPDYPPPAFLIDSRHSAPARPSLGAPPKPARSWLPGIIATLLGGLIAVVLVLVLNPRGPGPVEGAGSEDATAASDGAVALAATGDAHPSVDATIDGEVTTPEALKIMISVKTSPSGAKVFLGEEQIGETPLELERPFSPDAVQMRIVRAGYRPALRQVILNRDLILELTLSKQPSSPQRGPLPGVPMKKTL